MPVRDGRWISTEHYLALAKERKDALAQEEPNAVPEAEAPKPKRARRSRRAAEAALTEATGLTIDLED